jgi:hypothetical protein
LIFDAVWDEVVRMEGERDEELRCRHARGLAPISCKKCSNDFNTALTMPTCPIESLIPSNLQTSSSGVQGIIVIAARKKQRLAHPRRSDRKTTE